jgi:hypothetical protein
LTTSTTGFPGLTSEAAVKVSPSVSVQRPSSVSRRSPAFNPPAAAGLFSNTFSTITPSARSSAPLLASKPHTAAGASTAGSGFWPFVAPISFSIIAPIASPGWYPLGVRVISFFS